MPAAIESKQTVLVVDDDARLRDLLCTVLTPLDCELVQAGSGEEALTALLQRKVAVIVLDINMPGMGGFETAQLIREADELASTPIIFLTGQADDKDLNRGYDLGAVDYLLKPVSSAVLYAKVKALLELDRSFARLRIEAARLHEQQLQIARAAESRQREELALARRRARLATIFTEGSLDLASLEKTIVIELSRIFGAECLLRLPVRDNEWHDSFSDPDSDRTPEAVQAWLAEQVAGVAKGVTPHAAVLVEELMARGEHVGYVCVGRTDGPPFSEVEAALFRGVSAAAALAISNATLFRVQAEYAAVMQATADAILAVDATGAIRSCNKAATALFGGNSDSLIGQSIVELAVDHDRDRLREQLDLTLAAHQEISMEMTFAPNARRPVDVLITLSPIGDSVDLHVAVVVHDLTEIKQAQLVISHLASHDPLTDLANRRQLNERLAVLARQRGEGKLAALLYMDVNRFKAVNDTYGHDTGDELLVEIAARLRAAARSDALVCRIGGDEFIVLFEEVPSTSAAVSAGNRILQRVQEEPVRCKNVTLNPSLSMGISCLGASAHTPEELLSQADMAMFESKKNRLDECVLYTDLIGSRHQGKVDLRAEVAGAIARSEFRMAYQPIINSATGALFGLEALVRWRVGDEEMPATDIIALAESAGQIRPLSRWIVARSFADFASLGRSDLKLHVNLSPDHVLDGSLLDDLIAAQQDNRIPPDTICLELTERTFYGDPAPARLALRRARNAGFNLAIDDFGIDHASMTNLLHIPVDWLKIDRTFVAQLDDNPGVQRLVRSQIALAACMQVDLIAEGVENQKQADWLREAGCVLQQGFSYAHPIEADDLATELKHWAVGRTDQSTGEG
ncbi:diguanylate cyclase (GGDEF)-like protein/PAS domain S-box-containing protein [Mycolicibacterium sp. BK556]|uniref:two-component system response regulator n=1 Tax=unclassified Mycolicibacterium TaxID=2636767 RepID=UPI001606FE71|nr:MULTISPECIES: EAL domain-containing protein [unclassified Mycolicibacterium]MBB3601124.1 diguanylate cyclase (GGDEF)-like protein/PAS domain S-box-containing protein [Mycolicibacterium sp. BK556]MBB3630878.1 diguanylate cyclase (GGDEF)-like protein/PAS domain S-box-containing protein [Mycolicibacterium sp. BK607]MBB3748874.1 diguanylate cyclase (GGDEF)-like protein/PAS domain S-box-containing protein [Mycolicibacterium sp. BK634]